MWQDLDKRILYQQIYDSCLQMEIWEKHKKTMVIHIDQ